MDAARDEGTMFGIKPAVQPPGRGQLGRVSYMRNQTRIAASTTPARYVTASLS